MPEIRKYDRQSAVDYAHQWAFSRNAAYYNFDALDGDCTNFASQCLHAGAHIMNYAPVTGWFYISSYNRTASWTGVTFLYNFLMKSKGAGPFAKEVPLEDAEIGDIIQLDFTGSRWAHTPFVVQVGNPPAPDNILIAAHTNDADYRAINTYYYQRIRVLHIEGVRV